MTVIELIMHLRKSVSDKGMDIAVADGNGNIIQLNEKNLVIGCCGKWCKGVEEKEDEREVDD